MLILLSFGARNHVLDDEGTAVPTTMDAHMTAAVRRVRTQTMTVRGALLYT